MPRFGRGDVVLMPACGRDYCDDDPKDLIEESRFVVRRSMAGMVCSIGG